jgi:acyl dehydratase
LRYLDDIKVGDRYELGSHTFQTDDIKAFARRYDPQRFHLDEGEAERSPFGALCASGWHTASVWMRLMVDYRKRMADDMRRRGEPVATTGPAPGFRDLKWLKPVYVGDTIAYATEVTEVRPSASRPAWGLLSTRGIGVNQRGEMVISVDSTIFVERRPEAA